MAIDPVCKMTVDEKTAKFTTELKEQPITSVLLAAKRHLRRILKTTWIRTVKL
jgi:hypothetical protein